MVKFLYTVSNIGAVQLFNLDHIVTISVDRRVNVGDVTILVSFVFTDGSTVRKSEISLADFNALKLSLRTED